MLQMDLEEVTSKQLRMQLEREMSMELSEYKGYLDQQMLRILGQMERPSEIYDYLFLVSRVVRWLTSRGSVCKGDGGIVENDFASRWKQPPGPPYCPIVMDHLSDLWSNFCMSTCACTCIGHNNQFQEKVLASITVSYIHPFPFSNDQTNPITMELPH